MSYSIEIYRLDVVAQEFVRIAIIDNGFNDLSFFSVENGIGGCSFNISLGHPAAKLSNFYRYVNHVAVKKDNGVLWFGPITHRGVNASGAQSQLKIEALEYGYHLQTRFTEQDLDYYNTEATTIFSEIISDVQARDNGALLITNGTLKTVGNIDLTGEYENVLDLLKNRSDNINSFQFDFLPQLDSNNLVSGVLFNMGKTLGVIKQSFPKLEFEVNVDQYETSTNTDIYNDITGLGFGTGENIIQYNNSTSASQTSFTRREDVRKYSTVKYESTLAAKVDKELIQSAGEKLDLTVNLKPGTISAGSLRTGDVVNLQVENVNDLLSISGQRKVVAISYVIAKNQEYIYPTFEIIE